MQEGEGTYARLIRNNRVEAGACSGKNFLAIHWVSHQTSVPSHPAHPEPAAPSQGLLPESGTLRETSKKPSAPALYLNTKVSLKPEKENRGIPYRPASVSARDVYGLFAGREIMVIALEPQCCVTRLCHTVAVASAPLPPTLEIVF